MPEQSLVIKNVRAFQFLLCLLSHPWWQTLPFHTAAPVRAFRSSTPAMALDSEATFKARCQEMHMTDGVYDALHAASIATFAQLAFCTPHSSSGIDDAALMSHLRGILEDRLKRIPFISGVFVIVSGALKTRSLIQANMLPGFENLEAC